MPTYSAIQLDRFLEPKATTTAAVKTTSFLNKEDSVPKLERRKTTSLLPLDDLENSNSSRRSGEIPPPYPQLRRRNSVSSSPQFNCNNVNVRPPITPALYTTPEPTPLPVSPTSSFPPPSPYLINHKRRGPRLWKSFSEQNVAETLNVAEVGHTRSLSEENVISERVEAVDEVNGDVVEVAVEDENGGGLAEVREGEAKEKEKGKSRSKLEREGGESEDFFDPQESMSYSSSNEVEDFGGERSARAITPVGEFYDAWEELSSDSGKQGVQCSLSDVETELREMRLTLMMEIEKRKEAEEAVQCMQSQWRTLREKLGTTGVVLPADLASLKEGGRSDASPADDICRQIHMARFVSESIGRGIARAEFEAEMEGQLEVKNFEIARLCDRLHYYETMNREMSQRNQEAVEIARRDRQTRRRRQKWVWGSIATAITLGSAALAWSYLPAGNGSSSTETIEASKPDSDVQR